LGKDHLACASTGNAAASLATLTARATIACTIFVPASAPQAKLAQLLLHGANVIRVDASYDTAYEITLRLLDEHGWYSRNCAHNPLLVEGKKTAGLEIAAALNWQPPAAVFAPVGDGCIVTSVAKAFSELRELGLCTNLPRVYGVQAAGAAPIARAWEQADDRAGQYSGRDILAAISPLEPASCADSIAVGVPRNRVKAWQYVAGTGGGFLSVSDEEILAAVRLLAREAGLFAEPSAAAALAGINRAKATGLIDPDDLIVAMVTGHGLKDPGPALATVTLPEPVSPQGPFPF
jgi:threonine synthase